MFTYGKSGVQKFSKTLAATSEFYAWEE